MDKEGNVLKRFKSIKEASETTGVDRSNISHVCREVNQRTIASGYKWKFG
jgi:hypothetical protein